MHNRYLPLHQRRYTSDFDGGEATTAALLQVREYRALSRIAGTGIGLGCVLPSSHGAATSWSSWVLVEDAHCLFESRRVSPPLLEKIRARPCTISFRPG